jgi:hypothetical protein
MQFRGNVLSGGKTVLSGIQGDVQLTRQSGSEEWAGHFVLPKGQFILPGMYRLVLDDGRSGDIFISHAPSGLDRATVAYFTVSGPLQ